MQGRASSRSSVWGNRSLRTKLGALAVAALVGLGGVSSVALSAMRDISSRTDEIGRIAEATRSSLEADMAHDAVRGDVLQAMYAPPGTDVAATRAGVVTGTET